MPAIATSTQPGMLNHGCATAPAATRNSRSVAAATPRLAPPAVSAAEPVTTTSLKYWPGLAPAGTTRSSGTRADCP